MKSVRDAVCPLGSTTALHRHLRRITSYKKAENKTSEQA